MKVKVKNEKRKIIHYSLLLLHFMVLSKLLDSQTPRLPNYFFSQNTLLNSSTLMRTGSIMNSGRL